MNHHSFLEPTLERIATAYLMIVGSGRSGDDEIERWLAAWKIVPLDQVWLAESASISIGDVRAFERQLQLAPLVSPRRVGIIRQAKNLTAEANHAFLKFLEDPPTHVTTILVVEHEDQVLPTIISRCQRWRIPSDRTNPKLNQESPADTNNDKSLDLGKLTTLDYRERFSLAETWAKSTSFVSQFDELIVQVHAAYVAGQIATNKVCQLLAYRQLATTNTNPRLLAEASLMVIERVGKR
ncbi:MAG: hypothetical protein AAB647_01920 [Patescibacteria group bacterium]